MNPRIKIYIIVIAGIFLGCTNNSEKQPKTNCSTNQETKINFLTDTLLLKMSTLDIESMVIQESFGRLPNMILKYQSPYSNWDQELEKKYASLIDSTNEMGPFCNKEILLQASDTRMMIKIEEKIFSSEEQARLYFESERLLTSELYFYIMSHPKYNPVVNLYLVGESVITVRPLEGYSQSSHSKIDSITRELFDLDSANNVLLQ